MENEDQVKAIEEMEEGLSKMEETLAKMIGEEPDITEEEMAAMYEAMSDDEKAEYEAMSDDEKAEYCKMKKSKASKQEDKPVEKADGSDGADGSDSAEDIINDLPEVTADNVAEVAKRLKQAKLLINKNREKQESAKFEKVAKSVSRLTAMVSKIAANQVEQAKAIENMAKAQGLYEPVVKSVSEMNQRQQVNKSQDNLANAIAAGVAQAMRLQNGYADFNSPGPTMGTPTEQVHKSIREDGQGFVQNLSALFKGRPGIDQ